MSKRPFKLRSKSEVRHVRTWLTSQVNKGALPIIHRDIDLIQTEEDALRFIARELTQPDRVRLQKALSAKRARDVKKREKSPPEHKIVQSQMTKEARNILNAVALSKGMTTSELITSTFGDAFKKLDD